MYFDRHNIKCKAAQVKNEGQGTNGCGKAIGVEIRFLGLQAHVGIDVDEVFLLVFADVSS